MLNSRVRKPNLRGSENRMHMKNLITLLPLTCVDSKSRSGV